MSVYEFAEESLRGDVVSIEKLKAVVLQLAREIDLLWEKLSDETIVTVGACIRGDNLNVQIPKEIAKRMGLKIGDRLKLKVEGNKLILRK